MSRIVALDVGDARIGVAATDELGLTAHPVSTIHRSKSIKADLRVVEELLGELDASKVVVGLPLLHSGQEGPQAVKVRDFYGRLARRLHIDVVLYDESLSTVEAEELLLEADVSREKRRQIIDQMAAMVILKSYMDSLSLDDGPSSQ
ncbi:MAG: Holliday junction resolvase RuvX [Armatimonadetes bacterium]|jgi:putative Holliday junction resolvase|nr:Holliday junction resolvase RuvX [Armatimonadota bacterium]